MKTRPRKMTVNPFVSEAQRKACYAADDPNWDCSEWESKTKGKLPKHSPTTNCAPGQLRGADGRCGPGVGIHIPREQMPQIPGDKLHDFVDWARGQGVAVQPDNIPATQLSPTQKEFRQSRVDAIPETKLSEPILVSGDDYILDGTHRWVKHWQRNKLNLVPVLKIGLPITDALALAKRYPNAKFAANAAAKPKKSKNPLRVDPSRTAGLRRRHVAMIRKRFAIFKGRLRQLIVGEDAFGLKAPEPFKVENAKVEPPVTNSAIINLPDIRQPNHYACGAAAAMAVGMYFGRGPNDIREWEKALGTTLAKSTDPKAITDYLTELGLTVYPTFGLSVDSLERETAAGNPVICPVQDYGSRREPGASFLYGHYLTVIGVTQGAVGERRVIAQDSSEDNVIKPGTESIQEPGRVLIREMDWIKVWHDIGADGTEYLNYGIIIQNPGVSDAMLANSFFSECERDGGGRCVAGTGGLGTRLTDKAIEKVKGSFAKFTQRYGKAGAIAMFAAIAVTMPLPGNILGVVAGAEAIRGAMKLVRNDAAPDMADDCIALAVFLAGELGQPKPNIQKLQGNLNKILKKHAPELSTNAGRFSFHSTPQKLDAFRQWIATQVGTLFLSNTDQDLWQAYAEAGWKQGAGRAWDDTNQKRLREKRPDLFTDEKQDELRGFYQGSRSEFLESAFNQPVSQERIQVLASRSFSDLKNVTDDMATRMGRTLTDGLARGDSPYDVANELADDLDIGQARAEMIARTEIIRAHAEGQLDAFEKMGVQEIGVEVEWLATADDRTCPECESMEGTIFSIDEARGMIPAHPNCRCAFAPANVGEDNEEQA